MKSKRLIKILFLISLSTISVYSQTNSWRGLTPLVSTRADVEKLLGKPQNPKTRFEYEVEEGKVSFSYQEKICDGGWKVGKDTVISINFESKDLIGKSFDELKLDKSKFARWQSDDMASIWSNAQDGIGYHYYSGGMEFSHIQYFPRKADNKLRCNGFPPFAPEAYHFTILSLTFYNPNEETIYEIYNRIDSDLSDLNGNPDFVGYIMVYFDNKLSLKAYRKRLKKIRNHVFNYRKFNPTRYKIIEGGMMENSLIEFYILNKNQIPPAPNPTLPSPQFMKKK